MVIAHIDNIKPVRVSSYTYGFLLPKKLFKDHILDVNKSYEVIIHEK